LPVSLFVNETDNDNGIKMFLNLSAATAGILMVIISYQHQLSNANFYQERKLNKD